MTDPTEARDALSRLRDLTLDITKARLREADLTNKLSSRSALPSANEQPASGSMFLSLKNSCRRRPRDKPRFVITTGILAIVTLLIFDGGRMRKTWPTGPGTDRSGHDGASDCWEDEFGPSWWTPLDADPDAEEVVN